MTTDVLLHSVRVCTLVNFDDLFSLTVLLTILVFRFLFFGDLWSTCEV